MSPEFEEAFSSGFGGCRMDCACGRTHFDNSIGNGWTWEEGEREELERLAQEEPDRYLPCDGSVGSVEVGGMNIVIGCPCNKADQYEKFITSHGRPIAAFLLARGARLLKEAQEINEETKVDLCAEALALIEVSSPWKTISPERVRKFKV